MQLEDLTRKNEFIQKENATLDAYLRRHVSVSVYLCGCVARASLSSVTCEAICRQKKLRSGQMRTTDEGEKEKDASFERLH
jgi:hypothetical protein